MNIFDMLLKNSKSKEVMFSSIYNYLIDTNETHGALFNVTLELNNTGLPLMYYANISITPEIPGDWNASINKTECGNISGGNSCITEFEVETAKCLGAGTSLILGNGTWQNADFSINTIKELYSRRK